MHVAANAERDADARHRGKYESEGGGATSKPRRRGSLVEDAASVGAATVASGGTPGEAAQEAESI